MLTFVRNPAVIPPPSLQVSASFLCFGILKGYRVGITGIKALGEGHARTDLRQALGGDMLGQISGRHTPFPEEAPS